MAQALTEKGLVGVGKIAIRERERLCALRVSDGLIVLETMHWPEEIRDAKFDELKGRAPVQDVERKMAGQLIQQLSEDFEPSRFKDEYHSALQKLIKKKVKGEEIVVPEPAEEPSRVGDLMEALRASVEAARRGQKPREGSRQRSPARKAKSAAIISDLSKGELEKRARKLGVEGRTKMTKAQLARAIRRAG
jgi:DNA end-binding protein Ku